MRYVGFVLLTAATMDIKLFWDVIPCSLVDVCYRPAEACRLHLQDDLYPEARDSSFLLNYGEYLPDYTASHPRRQ
jgi:hypothetical protein